MSNKTEIPDKINKSLQPTVDQAKGLRNEAELIKELERVFNCLGIDSQLNTPDYMLAEYVVTHLVDIKLLIDCRRAWGCK